MFMDYLERMQDQRNIQRELEARVKRELYAQISVELSGMVESDDITLEQYQKVILKLARLLFKPA